MQKHPHLRTLISLAIIAMAFMVASPVQALTQDNSSTMDATEVVDAVGPGVVTVINAQ